MEKVAIIGTGRMGSLIARKIADYYNLIMIDKNIRVCGLLANEIQAIATDEYSLLKNANFIIIALPASAIPHAIEELFPYLRKEQVLINISTDTQMDTFKNIKDLCKFASAKIIGHALQIEIGELPLIVIDAEDDKVCRNVAEIFGKIGVTILGDEKIVKQINNIASKEGIKAALNIKKRMHELNIPEEYTSFAIRNVACGTMKAFAVGDAGSFAQKIINELTD